MVYLLCILSMGEIDNVSTNARYGLTCIDWLVSFCCNVVFFSQCCILQEEVGYLWWVLESDFSLWVVHVQEWLSYLHNWVKLHQMWIHCLLFYNLSTFIVPYIIKVLAFVKYLVVHLCMLMMLRWDPNSSNPPLVTLCAKIDGSFSWWHGSLLGIVLINRLLDLDLRGFFCFGFASLFLQQIFSIFSL